VLAWRALGLSLALSLSLTSCDRAPENGINDLELWDAVAVGSFVVTEILAHPNASRPEFIEIENTSNSEVNLQACELVDGGSTAHSFVINQPTPVAAGERILLGGAAFLGANDGELPVTVQWADITLNQGDETESVSLNCPDGEGARHQIDSVVFDWNGMGLERGRSWQLAVATDATSNDDPANWCEAPAQDDAIYAEVDGVLDYGSPGEAAVCETPGGALPQTEGDIVITEIVIDVFTGLREWFEIHNPGTENVDIRNCVIGEGPVDGSSASEHTIDYELGSTVLAPGGYLLLASGGVDVTTDGSAVADYPYSSLAFVNSGSHAAWVDCPAGDQMVRIDQIVFDWSDYGSNFKGYAITLSPDSLSAEANDDNENWCLASDEDVYFSVTDDDPDDPTTYTARGTPGQANSPCPTPGPPPSEGDLVITEILVDAPTGLREWFEIHNPVVTGEESDDVDLTGCTMLEHADGETCAEDDSGCRYEFIASRGQTTIPDGGYLLVGKTAAEITPGGELLADHWYSGSITFTNAGLQRLSIVCSDELGEDVEVDTVTYDWDDFESAASLDLQGRSLSLSGATTTASANDVSSNWCPASDDDLYYPVESGTDSETEAQLWGTPRAANPNCP